jgi:UDP-glucose 4-epimerase
MKYLITGGAGFIGSNIAARLVEQGEPVRILDDFSTGKRENIAPLLDRLELIEGNMVDPAVCIRACQGVDVVLHHAARPSVPSSVVDPVTSHHSNINGTFNMLIAARDTGVKRFIYAASSSAYGESEVLPKVETMPTQPLSPYAVQKLTGEHYCSVFAKCYGLQTISFRYFNVFGPQQDPTSQYAAAIPAFVSAILKNEPPIVYGDGEQTRDFTYVENVIQANLLGAKAPETNGQVINVACGEHISVNEIIREINVLLNKNVEPQYVEPRKGDIKHSWADISQSAEVIGFKPVVPFAQGLRLAIDWYAKNLAI